MTGGGAPRIGLIVNPLSRALSRGRHGIGETATVMAGVMRAAPGSRAGLREALAGFAAGGVGLLAVQGGDGTLREVLTALPGAFGDRPPDIAVMATGKTNLAARVMGGPGPGEAALARLREAAARGALRRRSVPVLEVERPGLEEAPLRGLLFGAAAFTEAKLLADRALHHRGIQDRLAVFLAMAGVAVRTLRRAPHPLRAHPLQAGVPMAVAADGAAPLEGSRFLLLATPLDRLMLGFWPFWGEGEGPVRWLDVAAPPERLAAALLAARMGRPRPWMPAAGYRSGRAARVAVRTRAPFVLDGEVFEPGPGGLVISAPGRVAFVTP